MSLLTKKSPFYAKYFSKRKKYFLIPVDQLHQNSEHRLNCALCLNLDHYQTSYFNKKKWTNS